MRRLIFYSDLYISDDFVKTIKAFKITYSLSYKATITIILELEFFMPF